jgi:hypothetical protein
MTTTPMEAPSGWFSRIGMELLSFFAQFGDAGGGASSSGSAQSSSKSRGHSAQADATTGKRPPFPMPECCVVYYPNGPFCDYPGTDPSQYTCPPGYYRQWWFCPTTNSYGACAECTQDQSTCWRGPFQCSTWWYL